jgi:hypothetical protein
MQPHLLKGRLLTSVRTRFLIILAIILAGSVLFGLSDTRISITDTGVPNREVTSSLSGASDSSASATVTITMYTVATVDCDE